MFPNNNLWYYDEIFYKGQKNMRHGMILLAISLTLTLTHCASYDFSRRYVQQGNLLPQEKINRLHVGMSKQDTAILMGTSLLSPLFATNRWDYAYTSRHGSNNLQTRHLTVYFSGNKISAIEHHP